MVINAFKMDGLGNDFIIIDCRDEKINFTKKQIIKLCDRSFLGCDQLILIYASNRLDAELIFYNSDGSESATCGNGTRCVAYLISKEKNKKSQELCRSRLGAVRSEEKIQRIMRVPSLPPGSCSVRRDN